MRKILLKYSIVFSLVAISGAALMNISHRVQILQREITAKQNTIDQEEESIRVLKAEWAYLNDPARLESIAANVMGMTCPQSEDMLSKTDIPEEGPLPAPVPFREVSYGATQDLP